MFVQKLVVAMLAMSLVLSGCSHFRGNDDDPDAVEQTITMDQVPASVRAAFERDFPSAQVREIEKEVYKNGTVHYAFEFTTKDGKKREVEYSAEGEQLPEH